MPPLPPVDDAFHAAAMTDERCLSDIRQVAKLLDEFSEGSLFLVADAAAYHHSGAEDLLGPMLGRFQVNVFQEFQPNPKFEDVQRGLDQFRRNPAEIVLTIGGGTAMDIAKLVATFAPQSSDPRSLILGQESLVEPAVPLIAIPTTSGTGSEATQFAVVYLNGIKHSVDHPSLMPAWCVLDPKLTATLPSRITAQTGLDAFCQAIESLWSVRSTPLSTPYATEAVQLALAHLPDAVHTPTPSSRSAMCRAAHLAGRAINLTRTTGSHAISYALTSDHGIPHGHAVALTLGPMLLYNHGLTNEDNNDPRGIAHVHRTLKHILGLLGCSTPQEGCRRIQEFVQAVGCEICLSELGITGEQALRSIAGKVNTERLNNNPRSLTGEQLLALLQSIA
jgi:alcohol dehydrogenase